MVEVWKWVNPMCLAFPSIFGKQFVLFFKHTNQTINPFLQKIKNVLKWVQGGGLYILIQKHSEIFLIYDFNSFPRFLGAKAPLELVID